MKVKTKVDNYENTHMMDASKELFDACFRYDLQKLRNLIQSGADVNQRDAYGNTALHVVLENRPVVMGMYHEAKDLMYAMCKELLEAGAQVNAKDNYGRTPLHNAAGSAWHDENLYAMMLQNDADPNIQDFYGATPLHAFTHNPSRRNTQEIFKLFIRHGANVKIRNKEGYTALEGYAFENELKRYTIKVNAQKEKADKEKPHEEVLQKILDKMKGKFNHTK